MTPVSDTPIVFENSFSEYPASQTNISGVEIDVLQQYHEHRDSDVEASR
jgi:hypothetical protein